EYLSLVRSSCSSWTFRGHVRLLLERHASRQSRKPETDKCLRPLILRRHDRLSSRRLQHQSSRPTEISLPSRPRYWQSISVHQRRCHKPHRSDDRLPQGLRVKARNEPRFWVPHSSEKEPRHSLSIRRLRDCNCSRRWHGDPPYSRLGLSQVWSSERRHWADLRRHQQSCDGIRQPCNSPACPEIRNCSDNRANARNVHAVSFLDSVLAQLRHCLLNLHRQKHANDDVQPRTELSLDGLGSSRRAICSFCHRGLSLEAAQLVQHRHRGLHHGSSNESQQHLPRHTVHGLHGTLPECDHVLLAFI